MLKDHAQTRATPEQRLQHPLDEYFFAVEQVDRRISHFTVHQQRHTNFFHLGQRRIALGEVGNAGVGIGRRAGRIQLDGMYETAVGGLADFIRRRVIRQVRYYRSANNIGN